MACQRPYLRLRNLITDGVRSSRRGLTQLCVELSRFLETRAELKRPGAREGLRRVQLREADSQLSALNRLPIGRRK